MVITQKIQKIKKKFGKFLKSSMLFQDEFNDF